MQGTKSVTELCPLSLHFTLEHFGEGKVQLHIYTERVCAVRDQLGKRCWVMVDSLLKVSTWHEAALKKANSMLGVIRKGIMDRSTNVLIQTDCVSSFGIPCKYLITTSQSQHIGARKGIEEVNQSGPRAESYDGQL